MVGFAGTVAVAAFFVLNEAKFLRNNPHNMTVDVPRTCAQENWNQAQQVMQQAIAAETLLKAAKSNSSLVSGAQKVLIDLRASLRTAVETHEDSAQQEDLLHMTAQLKKLSMLASQQASRSLSELLGVAAETQAPNSNSYKFLHGLRVCGSCLDFERVGEANDGGYIICADGLASGGLHGAYSYGINGFDGWGMDMASRYHVPLYEYDCFDIRAPTPCAGCQVQFFPECIQGNHDHNAGSFKTLSQQLARNGHGAAADSSLLMKLDIEGGEYPVWSQEQPADLVKFRHINTEFHWIGRKAYESQSVAAIQTLLNAGFAVAHLHGNNHAGTAHFGRYSVPDVIEVTMVRQAPGTPCANYPPSAIPEDRPCSATVSELPNPVLPSM